MRCVLEKLVSSSTTLSGQIQSTARVKVVEVKKTEPRKCSTCHRVHKKCTKCQRVHPCTIECHNCKKEGMSVRGEGGGRGQGGDSREGQGGLLYVAPGHGVHARAGGNTGKEG